MMSTASSATSSVPAWVAVAVAIVGTAGVVIAALVAPIAARYTRRDQLNTYRRNVYRNYLDHAYWLRSDRLDSAKKLEREVLYVADWHRIQLISDSPALLEAIKDLRDPGALTEAREPAIREAMVAEVGHKGTREL